MTLKKCRTKAVLTTFIGPWSLRDGDGAPREFNDLTIDEAVDVVKADAEMQHLWERFKAYCLSVKASTLAVDYAACLEICPSVFDEKKPSN